MTSGGPLLKRPKLPYKPSTQAALSAAAKQGWERGRDSEDLWLAGHSLGATCANVLFQARVDKSPQKLERGRGLGLSGSSDVSREYCAGNSRPTTPAKACPTLVW